MDAIRYFALTLAALVLAGCASVKQENKQGQAASVIEFLYPGAKPSTSVMLATVAELKVLLRIGVAFVPDNSHPNFRMTEAERIELLGTVRQAFQRYPFVSAIGIIPSSYLQAGGSFP